MANEHIAVLSDEIGLIYGNGLRLITSFELKVGDDKQAKKNANRAIYEWQKYFVDRSLFLGIVSLNGGQGFKFIKRC